MNNKVLNNYNNIISIDDEEYRTLIEEYNDIIKNNDEDIKESN